MNSSFKRLTTLISQSIVLWMSLVFLFIFSIEAIGKRAFLCYILLAGIIFLLSLVIRSKFVGYVCTILGLVLFVCLAYVDVVHSLMFNDYFSASTVYIILETNTSESREFLAAGFDRRYVYVGVTLIISLVISLVGLFRNDNPLAFLLGKRILKIPILLPFFLVSIVSLFFLSSSFLPVIAVDSIQQYYVEKEVLNNLTSDKLGGEFTNVKHLSSDESEVYILILGESTTRQRMGLYAYERDNNPLLNAMSDSLLIYNDVISPHTHTISSLGKVLTNASFDEGEQNSTGSLIQLFNKAGFETYWLSNQCPIGMFESTVTAISNSCDRQVFLNANHNTYDEVLLAPLRKLLVEDVKKKLIIMHLMGTHLSYDKRYPEAYDVFHDQPQTQFQHAKAYASINTYDNAILYNDYIVSEVINELKLYDAKSCALYLSDHGEEVYKDKNFAIHAEYDDTKSMYDIPFLMWCSPIMLTDSNHLVFNMSRKYNSEDLIYTMADIAGITYDEFQAKKSIINPHFEEKRRLITDGKDYDEVFY